MGLNPIYHQTYQVIQDWMAQYGYSPSIRDLAKIVGIASSAMYARLLKMEEAGLIDWPARWGTGSYRQAHTMRIKKEV